MGKVISKIKKLPISDDEICERYESVTTPMINDVLRAKGLLYQTLPNTIVPIKDGMKACGIAFTIKGSKNLDVADEMEQRAMMLESITKNSICVWDTSGDDESAQWGEIMTMAAKRRGCRGAVVDGGVRDTDKVLEQNFPVFCRYRSSNGMLGRFRMINYQKPIMIGNTHIDPGDIICCDIEYDVLCEAEQILKNEVHIKDMVNDGMKAIDVVKNGGYF